MAITVLLKQFYYLTKPGIIRGNAMTAAAGFVYASGRHISLGTFAAMLGGLALIIASSCVINNYIDRDIDKKMARTKNRALVTGEISARAALAYAAVLGLAGSIILLLCTHTLTTAIALAGMFMYVVVYGYFKRQTPAGTVIGSISGAIPPVVGYTAVTGRLDLAALALFLVLVCWQMPHFYAIAIYRAKDYAAAGIPLLPIIKGMRPTKIRIVLYVIGFTLAAASLYWIGTASVYYLLVVLFAGGFWLARAVHGPSGQMSDIQWAKSMFFLSLTVLSVWSLALTIDALLR